MKSSPFSAARSSFFCLLLSASFTGAAPECATVAGTGVPGSSPDGVRARLAPLSNPYGLCRGPDGALYVCEVDNHRVRKITATGEIFTVAGTGTRGSAGDGGDALAADLNEPYEVRFNASGDLFVVDMKNNNVRRVDHQTHRISAVAGDGTGGFAGDGGPAVRARLQQPHSIQFDAAGDLFICDIGNHRIRRVEMKTGTITTFAGTGGKGPTPDGASIEGTPLHGPRAIDFDRTGQMWIALREGNAIYRLDRGAGALYRAAGTGKSGWTGDGGPALAATLSGPKGLSVAPDGNVYFADTESHTIRMLNVKSGRVEWVAGTGQRGDGPDGDPRKCGLARPHGIYVDHDGAIYIGDSESHRVRVIRGK